MIAVVLAAGVGSRLKPFTDSHPKALAPLGGIPILGRVLKKLSDAGARAAVVNVHHFSQQVIDYIRANDFGIPVEVSNESELLLDTAGAIVKIVRENERVRTAPANEAILVHNADIYTDFSIEEMLKIHKQAAATLLVEPSRRSTRAFLFDAGGQLCGWRNSTTNQICPDNIDLSNLTAAPFGGVHILRRAFLDDVSMFCGEQLRPCSIVDFYIGQCTKKHIIAYTPSAPYKWYDIGTTEKLELAQQAFSD